DGGLRATMRNQSASAQGIDGYSQTSSIMFDADGAFVGVHDSARYGEGMGSETTGTVEDGKLKLTVQQMMGPDAAEFGGNTTDQQVIDLSTYDDVLPTALLPLALGYHLREENPTFVIRMADYGEMFGV